MTDQQQPISESLPPSAPASWIIPADQVQSLTLNQPPVIAIHGTDGQDLVALHPDGRLEYGPGYEPDEAARVFWEAVQRWTTYPHLDGDVTVLGPEVFASSDGAVICWKGENYTRQPETAPDDLREQYAALFRSPPGGERLGDEPPGIIAEAVMAVRDTELQRLRAQVDSLIRRNSEYADRGIANGERADKAEAALARVREWLPVLRRAVDSLPAVCRYHRERLDPPQGIIHREACCDTGIPARRRREAEQALAALDRPQEQRVYPNAKHRGGNAEDCPACDGTNPPYPFICPGEQE